MFFLRRLTPFFIGLAAFLGQELILAWPNLFWASLVIEVLLILTLLVLFIGEDSRHHGNSRQRPDSKNLIFLSLPIFMTVGGAAFSLFLDPPHIGHGVAVLVSLANYFYIKNLYNYLYNVSNYQVNTLALISQYLGLLTAFLFFSTFFSLKVFLNYPVAPLILGVFLVSLVIITHTFWINKLRIGLCGLYGLAGAMLLAQAFTAITFLPTGYYVNAIGLLAVFYLYVNVLLAHVQAEFKPRNILNIVIISAVSLLMAFLSAGWQ